MSDAIANGSVQAFNYFVAQTYVEAFKALATAPDQKFVLMPMESSGIIGSIAGIAELAKEAIGKPDAPAVRVPPIPPRAGSRARVDDAFWVVGGPDLSAGMPVRIVGVDAMTLLVQPAD